MLQTLNILENFDLGSMGYNSSRYIHTLYQAMNLAFADRDFYYGDPYFPPEEPIDGLLSKEYAARRAPPDRLGAERPRRQPGDPYPFQDGDNPFLDLLERWTPKKTEADGDADPRAAIAWSATTRTSTRGTTSIQAADDEGWVVSITPSGGWVPGGHRRRDRHRHEPAHAELRARRAENPYNVVEPGKRPRATLTPGMALKDGKPYLSFAVQGGDTQDQNLLQFFLNVVEFGMNVQQAAEAANITSYQMYSSFGDHGKRPGRLTLHDDTPPWVRARLAEMGYDLVYQPYTSGPINAIWFDHEHGTFWGASSDFGEDYGIAW